MNDLRFFFERKRGFPLSPAGHATEAWRSILLWLLLVLPGGFALADDEAYTWKDDAGRVHFGNRPPEGQAATRIPVQPGNHIYSWKDAEGNVQYGGHPPSDVDVKQLQENDGSLSTIHAGQLRPGEKKLLRKSQ